MRASDYLEGADPSEALRWGLLLDTTATARFLNGPGPATAIFRDSRALRALDDAPEPDDD